MAMPCCSKHPAVSASSKRCIFFKAKQPPHFEPKLVGAPCFSRGKLDFNPAEKRSIFSPAGTAECDLRMRFGVSKSSKPKTVLILSVVPCGTFRSASRPPSTACWATLSRPCGTELAIFGFSRTLKPAASSSEFFRSLFSHGISRDRRSSGSTLSRSAEAAPPNE